MRCFTEWSRLQAAVWRRNVKQHPGKAQDDPANSDAVIECRHAFGGSHPQGGAGSLNDHMLTRYRVAKEGRQADNPFQSDHPGLDGLAIRHRRHNRGDALLDEIKRVPEQRQPRR